MTEEIPNDITIAEISTETPTNLQSEDPSLKINKITEGQKRKVTNIESDLNSTFINVQLEGIGMIPEVIDPIIRHKLEEHAYKIIMKIFEDLDLASPTSIANTLKTMGYVNYLSGNLKNQALRKASKFYYFLEKKCPLGTEIIHNPFLRELTVGDNSERITLANNTTPYIRSESSGVEEDGQSQTGIPNEDKETSYTFSNKEKIGWVLNLLRSESWPEIKKGVKLFYSLGKIKEGEVPKILIESTERKIIELITLGLNCKEISDDNSTTNKNGVATQSVDKKTIFLPTSLQKNSVYANLMAIDLISHVPERFQKALIETAEQNVELGDLAKEKLKKMRG